MERDDPARADEAQPRRRVVVADDHQTFVELLSATLAAQPDLECVGVATTLDEALRLVEEQQPDLVVLDVQFEGDLRDGIAVVPEIRRLAPGTQVVLLTGTPGHDVLRRGAASGASAVVTKDGSLPDLLTAIRSVQPGGVSLTASSLARLLENPVPVTTPAVRLTAREAGILSMLELGMDTTSISHELGITVNTTRGYVKTLLHKLDAHSQLQAVATARRLGLLAPSTRPHG